MNGDAPWEINQAKSSQKAISQGPPNSKWEYDQWDQYRESHRHNHFGSFTQTSHSQLWSQTRSRKQETPLNLSPFMTLILIISERCEIVRKTNHISATICKAVAQSVSRKDCKTEYCDSFDQDSLGILPPDCSKFKNEIANLKKQQEANSGQLIV